MRVGFSPVEQLEQRLRQHRGDFRLAASDFAPAADALVRVDSNVRLWAGRKGAQGGNLDVAAPVGDLGSRGLLRHEEAGRRQRAASSQEIAATQTVVRCFMRHGRFLGRRRAMPQNMDLTRQLPMESVLPRVSLHMGRG